MDCTQALSWIIPYSEGRLRNKQREQFLLHVCSCKNCYEELDIHFIVVQGIKGLDEDTPRNFDFTHMLWERIQYELREIKHQRVIKIIIIFLLLVLIVAAVAMYMLA